MLGKGFMPKQPLIVKTRFVSKKAEKKIRTIGWGIRKKPGGGGGREEKEAHELRVKGSVRRNKAEEKKWEDKRRPGKRRNWKKAHNSRWMIM